MLKSEGIPISKNVNSKEMFVSYITYNPSFQALQQLPREKIQLATKFAIKRLEGFQLVVKGTPEYVRQGCEASLERLGVDYIDLYYQHRVDTSVPIEDTVRSFTYRSFAFTPLGILKVYACEL